MNLCPRIQSGGRVPQIRNVSELEQLVKQFKDTSFDYATDPLKRFHIWAPFTSQTYSSFLDFYTGLAMPSELWRAGQPNGGKAQQCTAWYSNTEARLFDDSCTWSYPIKCLCQFDRDPTLILRGLCKASNIDTHYVLRHVNESIIYMGQTSTTITLTPYMHQVKWTLSVNSKQTKSSTTAKEKSYLLGRNSWKIEGDSVECEDGATSTRELKMSGCQEGEFTCSNGDCVRMEERCDQIPDCQDESDEIHCNLIVLKPSYRKEAPPVSLDWQNRTRKVTPASVNVTITLLDILATREAENEIDLKFMTTIQWFENRASYHNLKKKSSLNTIRMQDIENIWVPNLIYRNNKENADTRSALGKSKVNINRRGDFTRSGLDILDEIEIFRGEENPIIMHQSHTKTFQCDYNLKVFPFDTQVN